MGVELLQILSLVSYILAGLLFLVSGFLFFYLKVPALWGEVTGRTARKAIRTMQWKGEDASPKVNSSNSTAPSPVAKNTNATQSQSERSQDEVPTPKERLPLVASEQKPPLKAAPTPPVKEVEASTEDHSGKTGELPSADAQFAEDVVALSENGETTNLPVVGQTDILSHGEIGQTEILSKAIANVTDSASHSDIGETAVLSATAYNEFVARSTGELPQCNETTLLGQAQCETQSKAADVFFVMVKELAFTDSTEIIE